MGLSVGSSTMTVDWCLWLLLVEALVCISHPWSEEQYVAVLAQRQAVLDDIQETVHCSCFSRLVLMLQSLQLCTERSWANTLVSGAPVDFLLCREVRQTCLLGKLRLRTVAQDSPTSMCRKGENAFWVPTQMPKRRWRSSRSFAYASLHLWPQHHGGGGGKGGGSWWCREQRSVMTAGKRIWWFWATGGSPTLGWGGKRWRDQVPKVPL